MIHILSLIIHKPVTALEVVLGVILVIASLAVLFAGLGAKIIGVLVMLPCLLGLIYLPNLSKPSPCQQAGASNTVGAAAAAVWCMPTGPQPYELEQSIQVTKKAPNSFWGLRWDGGGSYSAHFGLETTPDGKSDLAVFSTDGAVQYSNKSCSQLLSNENQLTCFTKFPFSSSRSYELFIRGVHVDEWTDYVNFEMDVIDNSTRQVTTLLDVLMPQLSIMSNMSDEAFYMPNNLGSCNDIPSSEAKFGQLIWHSADKPSEDHYYQFTGFKSVICTQHRQGVEAGAGGTAKDVELDVD